MADRYETADDLADDLKRWLVAEAFDQLVLGDAPARARDRRRAARMRRVVPKGLRAFDIEDAGFFPTLVPGPAR